METRQRKRIRRIVIMKQLIELRTILVKLPNRGALDVVRRVSLENKIEVLQTEYNSLKTTWGDSIARDRQPDRSFESVLVSMTRRYIPDDEEL